jgi:hypothetical protein
VQVTLTLVASVATVLGGDAPAEVDGHPVPAETARGLLRAVTGADPTRATADAGAGVEEDPEFPPPDPDEYARYVAAEADFALWQEEFQRRIDAGEFAADDDGPPPSEREQPRPPERDAGPRAEAVDDAADDADEEADDWWAQADRAVEDASRALLAVQRAMAHAARMVRTATAYDAGDEATWAAGRSSRLTAATDALTALRAATTTQREELGRLLATTGGGGLVERPRIALTDALTGALLALTDLPGLRRAAHCGRPSCRRRPQTCTHDLTDRPGLGPPPPTGGYRPGAELDRFVRARDRRCRFPGCRRRVPRGGELDHDRPYPDGPTSAANVAGYCTADHRGKHQAPGWRHQLSGDGRLTVTTPTGLIATSPPPPY